MSAKPTGREAAAEGGNGRDLIAMLQALQDWHGYLPQEELLRLARQTGRSPVDIYAVATFYRSFRLTPRGRHVISVCQGTACHVRGAPGVCEAFERRLGIAAGGTTPDGEFTLETVNCLGACALGPVVVIDGRYFTNVRPTQVAALLAHAAATRGHVGDEANEGAVSVEASPS